MSFQRAPTLCRVLSRLPCDPRICNSVPMRRFDVPEEDLQVARVLHLSERTPYHFILKAYLMSWYRDC